MSQTRNAFEMWWGGYDEAVHTVGAAKTAWDAWQAALESAAPVESQPAQHEAVECAKRLLHVLATEAYWRKEIDLDDVRKTALALATRPNYQALYHELLFAVGNKYPGKSRHETALHYICRAEQSNEVAKCAAPTATPAGRAQKED